MKFRVLSNLKRGGLVYKAGDILETKDVIDDNLIRDGVLSIIKEDPKPVETAEQVEPVKPRKRGRKPKK